MSSQIKKHPYIMIGMMLLTTSIFIGVIVLSAYEGEGFHDLEKQKHSRDYKHSSQVNNYIDVDYQAEDEAGIEPRFTGPKSRTFHRGG